MSRKKGLRRRLEAFISSERGQRFFNFAYSIGAAVVIWGALFKIIHLPGSDLLLSIGMGTEVVMFILIAFDRPQMQSLSSDYSQTPTSTSMTMVENRPVIRDDHNELSAETDGVIHEMAKLRETTSALNALYEIQLKSMSMHISAIESGNNDARQMRDLLNKSLTESQRYCEETVKMADNMMKLNAIYNRMIEAMSSGNNLGTKI